MIDLFAVCLCLCRVTLDDSGMGTLDKAIYVDASSPRRERQHAKINFLSELSPHLYR